MLSYVILLQIHDPDEALRRVSVFLPLLLALRGSHAGLGGREQNSRCYGDAAVSWMECHFGPSDTSTEK